MVSRKVNYDTSFQSGFKKNRSTNDNLSLIKEKVKQALISKQILGLVI